MGVESECKVVIKLNYYLIFNKYCFLFVLQYAAGVVTHPFVLVSHMMIVNNVGLALLYILNTNLKIKLTINVFQSKASKIIQKNYFDKITV